MVIEIIVIKSQMTDSQMTGFMQPNLARASRLTGTRVGVLPALAAAGGQARIPDVNEQRINGRTKEINVNGSPHQVCL